MPLTISEAQAGYLAALEGYDIVYPYPGESGLEWRKQRNKMLMKPSQEIYKAIAATRPKPENDFQI